METRLKHLTHLHVFYKICLNHIWTNVYLDICSNTCFYKGHEYGLLYALVIHEKTIYIPVKLMTGHVIHFVFEECRWVQQKHGWCTILHVNSRYHVTITDWKCMIYSKCRNDKIVHASHNLFWSPHNSYASVSNCPPLKHVLNTVFALNRFIKCLCSK
jgi:hypothetical protein